MPLQWGPNKFEIGVDVVPGPLPFLLAKPDQIKMKLVLDAELDDCYMKTATEGLVRVPLRTAVTTGHWLVPISWSG